MSTELPTMERKQQAKQKPKPAEEVRLAKRTMMVEVPALEGLTGYTSRRVQIDRMTTKQSATLKAIRFGLEEQEAKLANGKHVKSSMHAILWLLENME